MNRRKTGAAYEEAAEQYLKNRGVRIAARNFRCRQGEADIIGYHAGYLVFIEVKYRRNASFGYPEDAVGMQKQRRICKAAQYYMYCHGINAIPVRFDVLSICGEQISWYRNAFDYQGYNEYNS